MPSSCRPSSIGIVMSSSTRSTCLSRSTASAASAELAVWIFHVRFENSAHRPPNSSRNAMLSSTNSTWNFFSGSLPAGAASVLAAATGAGFGAFAAAAELVTSILLVNEVPGEAAAPEASKRSSTSPSRSVWPGFTTASEIFWPPTNVPFVESRSRTSSSSPRSRTSQCRPEMDGSTIWNVLPSARPTVAQASPNSWAGTETPFVMTTSLAISIAKNHAGWIIRQNRRRANENQRHCPSRRKYSSREIAAVLRLLRMMKTGTSR